MAKNRNITQLLVLNLLVFSAFVSLKAQVFPAFGDSRTGTTGMQFLKIAPDARSAGMAGAYTAVVNDVSALYWNPAGVTGLDSSKIHTQLGHTQYFSETTMQYGGLVYRVSSKTLIGVNLVYLNSGEMDVTTEFLPFGNGQTFRVSNMGLGVTLARKLTENFGFGVTAKYINEQVAAVTTHNAVFDFGFQYDIGLANTRFAVGLANFGFNREPGGTIEVESLDGVTVVENFEEIAVPAVFRLGLAWDPIRKEDQRLTVAAQLNHPTDNSETYALGLEYVWNDLLLLRTGYLFGKNAGGLPSGGFGVYLPRQFGKMRLDYGFSHRDDLGSVHRLTLGFSLIDKTAREAAQSAPRQ